MAESKVFDQAVASGYLNLGRQHSDNQYESFIQLLKGSESHLSEDGIIIDWEECVGTAFRIHSPVGSIRAERIAFLNGNEVGAAIAFHTISHSGSKLDGVLLGFARLHDDQPWMFSGGTPIYDSRGRNVPASASHVVRLVLARKLMHDHRLATAE